jgi:hypothetical protein
VLACCALCAQRTGDLAELHGNQPFAPNLARLLDDLVWCETQGGYVNQPDRAKVLLRPLGVQE